MCLSFGKSNICHRHCPDMFLAVTDQRYYEGYPIWDLERCFPGKVQWYKDQFAEALKALSDRGVVILLATPIRFFIPDHEEGSIDETIPHCLLTPDSDIIVVGATDQQGRLWWYSMAGTQDCPVSVYAQGYETQAYILHDDMPVMREGTCFANPQVVSESSNRLLLFTSLV